MPGSTIARAAEAAGVGVETIRFYERRGLIAQPPKPARGFRTYPEETVARIRFIRQAQELGFSLAEVQELLALGADPEAECGAVRAQAEKKLAEVESKLARLEAIRTSLRKLIATCPSEGPAIGRCSILGAFHAPDESTDRADVNPSRRRTTDD